MSDKFWLVTTHVPSYCKFGWHVCNWNISFSIDWTSKLAPQNFAQETKNLRRSFWSTESLAKSCFLPHFIREELASDFNVLLLIIYEMQLGAQFFVILCLRHNNWLELHAKLRAVLYLWCGRTGKWSGANVGVASRFVFYQLSCFNKGTRRCFDRLSCSNGGTWRWNSAGLYIQIGCWWGCLNRVDSWNCLRYWSLLWT